MYVYLMAIVRVSYSGDNFIDVRLAALKALVDIVQGTYVHVCTRIVISEKTLYFLFLFLSLSAW